VDTPYVKGTYGIYHEPHPDEDGTGILAVYKGAIAVNREGRRFVDESLPYKEIGDAALAQPGLTTWQVFDAQVMAQSNDEVPIYEFAGRDRAGMLLRSDTVEGLEREIGLPAGSLVGSVADYNRRLADGLPDAHGRRHLSGGVGTPTPLDRPPFYAHPSRTVVLATYCGLTVDTRLRVLDVFGEPIECLYAAGEVIGGFHGGGYMTGTSIGKAGIFGRLAGRHAAAEESGLAW
jgi:fumarate reductase flavoprotein subunit